MGIYVHIPFCRSKCFYCGFYSVASDVLKSGYIEALCREMEMRKNYLTGQQPAETLYLGGGTPSYLSPAELTKIVRKLEDTFSLHDSAERTIEINPEDITPEKLTVLKELGFNRLSIGVQSFNDNILKRINRTHSGQQAVEAIENAQKAGFTNISMDLILGLPGQTFDDLEYDFKIIKTLPIKHLSTYILSIDSKSVLDVLLKKGQFKLEDDEAVADKYQRVCQFMRGIDFGHYEISNFAREGYHSVHNTAYWQQKPYIGLGTSAHSYNMESRQWNVSNIKTYIESLNNNTLNFECEELTHLDKYNEYIMTNLRTMWGADTKVLSGKYGDYWEYSKKKLKTYIESGYAENQHERVRLTEKGWLISDRIFCDLFAD